MVERTLISLPSQLQLIERLQHLIYLSSSIIFFSGEPGSGKSTLTESLSNILPDDLQQVYISLANAPSVDKLRQQVVTQLYDKPLFNTEDKLLNTIERLQKTKKTLKNIIVIIDNANDLSPSFTVELCELFLDVSLIGDNTLNVLFLVDEEHHRIHSNYIEEHLVSNAKKILNVVELKIPSLSLNEASILLQHNFQQTEYQAELQHQDALNQQLRLCNGNPKKIIKLANNLSHGVLNSEKSSWIDSHFQTIFIIFFFVSLAIVLMMYLYPKLIVNELSDKKLSSSLIANEIVNIKINDAESPISNASNKKQQQEALAGTWALSQVEIIDNENEIIVSDMIKPIVTIFNPEVVEIEMWVAQSEPVGFPYEIETKKFNAIALNVPKENKIKVDQLDFLQSEPLAKKAIRIEITSLEHNSIFTDNEILFSKEKNNFTLQLTGMASEESLTLFKVKHHLPQKNIFVYQTIRQNKPWFVVTYGEYDSLRLANSAAKNLPTTFYGMPTWIKKWQVVHNDLRLNNE